MNSIPELLEQVDVVLLESVDGRIHLQEAIPVIKAGKPLWIDKPVAGSLADAIAIFELAKQHNVPVFSSSSARFSPGFQAAAKNDETGPVVGAETWGPCSYSTGTPDMFFYGIHGIEPLFVLMGTGCETVSRVASEGTDLVTGVWKDGRVGTYRGIHKGKAAGGRDRLRRQGYRPDRKERRLRGALSRNRPLFQDRQASRVRRRND